MPKPAHHDEGKPADAPEYYEGQERFTDGQLEPIEKWTAHEALLLTRALDLPTREEQVARIRDAVDDGLLPEEGVDALISVGYTELA